MSFLTIEELKKHRNEINPVKRFENIYSDVPKNSKVEVKKRRNEFDFNQEIERINKEFKEL